MKPSEALARYGTKTAAARALNLPMSTFRGRLEAEIRQAGGYAHPEPVSYEQPSRPLIFPDMPDRYEPIEDLLDRCSKHYQRERDYRDAANWQQIKVNDDLPIGIALMGDPHIDDPGCNIPLLRRDVEIIKETPGCYALNVGDYTNNWVGRLARLFGNQELSQASARRLVEWFLLESGMTWLAVILGNHDEWNEGGEIIRRMCASHVQIPVHDWQAKIELVFPNKEVCRINAAHDFKGRSMYTPLHGLKRETIWHQDGAHLMVAGHIHFGGIEQCELPGGHNPWLVRVRGYKEMDHHALVSGFHEGIQFPSVMAVVDPAAPPSERVMVFGSLAQGAAVLSSLRALRRASQAPGSAAKARRKSSKSRSQPSRGRKQSRSNRGASPSQGRNNKRAASQGRQSRSRQARA